MRTTLGNILAFLWIAATSTLAAGLALVYTATFPSTGMLAAFGMACLAGIVVTVLLGCAVLDIFRL